MLFKADKPQVDYAKLATQYRQWMSDIKMDEIKTLSSWQTRLSASGVTLSPHALNIGREHALRDIRAREKSIREGFTAQQLKNLYQTRQQHTGETTVEKEYYAPDPLAEGRRGAGMVKVKPPTGDAWDPKWEENFLAKGDTQFAGRPSQPKVTEEGTFGSPGSVRTSQVGDFKVVEKTVRTEFGQEMIAARRYNQEQFGGELEDWEAYAFSKYAPERVQAAKAVEQAKPEGVSSEAAGKAASGLTALKAQEKSRSPWYY